MRSLYKLYNRSHLAILFNMCSGLPPLSHQSLLYYHYALYYTMKWVVEVPHYTLKLKALTRTRLKKQNLPKNKLQFLGQCEKTLSS